MTLASPAKSMPRGWFAVTNWRYCTSISSNLAILYFNFIRFGYCTTSVTSADPPLSHVPYSSCLVLSIIFSPLTNCNVIYECCCSPVLLTVRGAWVAGNPPSRRQTSIDDWRRWMVLVRVAGRRRPAVAMDECINCMISRPRWLSSIFGESSDSIGSGSGGMS